MLRFLEPAELEAASRALITATETSLGIEVTMPVVYPDGQAVTVVVTVEGGNYVVHDAGLGSMYLTNAGQTFTRRIKARLASLAKRYECDFIDGRMTRQCSADQLAIAIALVANASRSVGDQAADVSHRSEAELITSVTNRLREFIGKRLRVNEGIKGRSGREYRVHNVVLDSNEKSPIAFVEPISNRAIVPARFTEFSDLQNFYGLAHNIAVYDDAESLSDPDMRLLREVCEPLPFRETRDRFKRIAA